ncbi:MAG: hypothetical protein M1817_000246 [Caeruleum heppii]|nr:MAG: hypothetical protein M1817_000246 [Caeruleum heppii]
MTAYLQLVPPSPFGASFISKQYSLTPPPISRQPSTVFMNDICRGIRQVSTSSFTSDASFPRGPPMLRDENDPFIQGPLPAAPKTRLIVKPSDSDIGKGSSRSSHHSSWATEICPVSFSQRSIRVVGPDDGSVAASDVSVLNGVVFDAPGPIPARASIFKEAVEDMEMRQEESDNVSRRNEGAPPSEPFPSFASEGQESREPFKKWMNSLRLKGLGRRKMVRPSTDRVPLEDDDGDQPAQASVPRRKKSSSFSSMAFVTAIKTASVSLASITLPAKSRKSGPSFRLRSGSKESKGSSGDIRASCDSNGAVTRTQVDEEVWTRAVKRRMVLEEFISSEESYIGDMKILVNVYFTLLASVTTVTPATRDSIHANILEILHMHEELLGALHCVIPNSEYTQDPPGVVSPEKTGHVQWTNLDVVLEDGCTVTVPRRSRRSADASQSGGTATVGLVASPRVAADVADVFSRMMKRFFAYEEYGAQYECMVRDVASTYKSIPSWHAYEKGIEVLASSLASINVRTNQDKKGLTFSDLLIKPIQRVCRYPLLFADLAKYTPVCDGPEAHAKIEKVIYRLRETTREINKATDDPETRQRIEQTWLLQDKLIFPGEAQPSQAATIRLLGHITLCGVLHVAWQTPEGVQGAYMLCALFRSYLVLATPVGENKKFTVEACVNLASVKLEQVDNGKGLQCHTAPYSWKVVFEQDHRLFEVLLSACSAKEEMAWETYLHERSAAEALDETRSESSSQDILSSMTLNVKAIGAVYGQKGTLARRLSMHRAMTVGSRANLCQVIIKNTHALSEGTESPLFPIQTINRSQSLLSTQKMPILAPKRTERIRLETAVRDVWTKHMLPFPGMSAKKTENPIRASASSVMRKLSIASIASNFSKRSVSLGTQSVQHAAGAECGRVHSANLDTPEGSSGGDTNPTIMEEEAVINRHMMSGALKPGPSAKKSKGRKSINKGSRRLARKLSTKGLVSKSSFRRAGYSGDENVKLGAATTAIEPDSPVKGPGGAPRIPRTWSVDGVRKLFAH